GPCDRIRHASVPPAFRVRASVRRRSRRNAFFVGGGLLRRSHRHPGDGVARRRSHGMNVVLVDPSLYTGPYDAGLTSGLLATGVRPTWITRPVRPGDREEIPPQFSDACFYRRTDRLDWLPAGMR